MHLSDFNFDSRLGMVFGFVGFIWKISSFIFLQAEAPQSLLTVPNFIDSFIMAAWCTLTGLLVTWGVNWMKKKWLGLVKKKKDGN